MFWFNGHYIHKKNLHQNHSCAAINVIICIGISQFCVLCLVKFRSSSPQLYMLFTGMAGDIPGDFNTSVSDAEFSSTAINLERPILIPVHFFGSVCVCISLFAVCVSIHHSCTPSSHPSIHPPTHTCTHKCTHTLRSYTHY